jgi:MerR family transcriptional regulator, repressor of the yfmOP operon
VSGGERPGPLRIGHVAELTGTTPRTIRYYEEIGLLPAAPEREPGAHRLYEPADVERLQEMLRLKRLLGLSLDELRDLSVEEAARAARLREWHGGVEDPVRRREILDEGIRYVDLQLGLLRRRRDELDRLEQELAAKRRRLRSRLRALAHDTAADRA